MNILIKDLSGTSVLSLDGIGVLTGFDKSSPSVRVKTIAVPGRDGLIDATDALTGYPTYDNRIVTINMTIYGTQSECDEKVSLLLSKCHGQRRNIHCDWMPGYHFTGRMNVSISDDAKTIVKVSIKCDCDPYIYKDALTEKTISTGSVNLTSVMPTNITIQATSQVKLTRSEEELTFSIGEHTITYPKLYGSETWTIIQGTGKIKYQEGKL